MCSRACSEPFPLIASDLHKCREQYTLTSGNAIGKTKALFLAESTAPTSHWFSRRHIVAPRFETFPGGNKNRRRGVGGANGGANGGARATEERRAPRTGRRIHDVCEHLRPLPPHTHTSAPPLVPPAHSPSPPLPAHFAASRGAIKLTGTVGVHSDRDSSLGILTWLALGEDQAARSRRVEQLTAL